MAVVLPKLDGLTLNQAASFGLSQTYDDTPKFVARTMGGTAKSQIAYTKIRSVMSAAGWMLTGWEGLDLTNSILFSCMEAQSIIDASNVITLPAARRSDIAVRGYAIVNGQPVSTPVNVVTNTATLTTVGGASHYLVGYYPEFNAFIEINQTGNQGWTLTAQEI